MKFKIQKIVNSWTRWHPVNPLKTSEEYIDEFYEFYNGVNFKRYNDPHTDVGDIIEDHRRQVKIILNKFLCPDCNRIFPSEEDVLQHILSSENHPSKAVVEKRGRCEIQTTESEVKISSAKIYYTIVRPEEEITPVISVEYSSDKDKFPTVTQRIEHDEAIEKWKNEMKTTYGYRRINFFLLPNGSLNEIGLSGNWWYWCPQKLTKQGWVPLSKEECISSETDANRFYPPSDAKVRILSILAILPEEGSTIQEMEVI